jgi:hypothetical protein
MTATNHGLAGAAIAIVFHRTPAAAMVLAFLSHFVLDALPHFSDKQMSLRSLRFFRFLASDIIVAILTTVFVAFAYSEIKWLIVACAVLAASPDLLWLPYYYFKSNPFIQKLGHLFAVIQWSETPKGIILEAIFYVSALATLLYNGMR